MGEIGSKSDANGVDEVVDGGFSTCQSHQPYPAKKWGLFIGQKDEKTPPHALGQPR